MFETLSKAIALERQKLAKKSQWLRSFRTLMREKEILEAPWLENKLINELSPTIPSITKIAGVDGGIISEAMTGFDLILYRAVGAVFHGIGEKVESTYIPSFNPDPEVFFAPSLPSRQEFSKLGTLRRLFVEYDTAIQTIKRENPTVIFMDGKVVPLQSDFAMASTSNIVNQAEVEVKNKYRELVNLALGENVILCGVVKDSRSREISQSLWHTIPDLVRKEKLTPEEVKNWTKILEDVQDSVLGDALLEKGERTSWVLSQTPSWLSDENVSIWTCLVKPVEQDQPIRVEILSPSDKNTPPGSEIALSALFLLCNHGLPVAIPTVILEADERTKLSADHLEAIIDQISLSLGIPKEQLRKRRYFSSSLHKM